MTVCLSARGCGRYLDTRLQPHTRCTGSLATRGSSLGCTDTRRQRRRGWTRGGGRSPDRTCTARALARRHTPPGTARTPPSPPRSQSSPSDTARRPGLAPGGRGLSGTARTPASIPRRRGRARTSRRPAGSSSTRRPATPAGHR
eukprot:1586159-Rhodomonas_salina.1